MKLYHRVRDFHFEIYHFIILIMAIIISQVILAYINVSSTENLLNDTIDIYRLDTTERLAEFTTASIELLIQQNIEAPEENAYSRESTIESIDFIITQQKLQKNVDDICLIFKRDEQIFAIDDGSELFDYIKYNEPPANTNSEAKAEAIKWFNKSINNIFENENISNYLVDPQTFHVLVPFSVRGEVIGAVHMKISPNFEYILNVISSSFSRTGAFISALILLSLLAVFLITTYVINERDQAQKQLYAQREQQLKDLIEAQKEASFAKRIYHSHHKAEKIVGFIKEDLRKLPGKNIEHAKSKVAKYASFIGRVIYDMKTYNPPVNVIRNLSFQTNVNEVIEFILTNVIKRIYRNDDQLKIFTSFDAKFPTVNVNEFVVWEIIEPLIQNAIEHNQGNKLQIVVSTIFDELNSTAMIEIKDDGIGISPELLETDKDKIKKIFKENITTKRGTNHSGYGCFIAFENCKRCGWKLDAVNEDVGAKMIITFSQKQNYRL